MTLVIPSSKLHIVLVTAGEPLPGDRSDIRLHRTGQLAEWLASHGHHVEWVTNRFDHFRKLHRPGNDSQVIDEKFTVHLLRSPGYGRNVGPGRLLDHAILGREFRRRCTAWATPDVVVAAMPTIELTFEAVRWARAVGAASVVDIRDLWPDVFIERIPPTMRWAARRAFSGLQRKLNQALAHADAIISPNIEFIDWACQLGRRARGAMDLSFPLAYERREISQTERTEANAFWQSHGVRLEDTDSPILVYAGSLSTGVDFLPIIELLRFRNASQVRIVICGTGEQQPGLQRMAVDHPNLFVPGWCSYSQLRVVMERSIVGLMPYRPSANFLGAIPNKAAEYLAHGLPIAWTINSGPLAELIQANDIGVLYGHDARVLSAFITRLKQSQTERDSIRATALSIFRERFDAASVNARFEDFLRQLTRRTREHETSH